MSLQRHLLRVALACLVLANVPAHAEIASWYRPGFYGRRTANGEQFDSSSLTAAHHSLSFGTRVRVTNQVNGRSVVVRINDRGPIVKGRSIDLTAGAARAIGVSGVSRVALKVVR